MDLQRLAELFDWANDEIASVDLSCDEESATLAVACTVQGKPGLWVVEVQLAPKVTADEIEPMYPYLARHIGEQLHRKWREEAGIHSGIKATLEFVTPRA